MRVGACVLPSPLLQPEPPLPVEAVSRWKRPPWRGLGVHVTWGFRKGDWTPEQLVGLIAGTRVEWAFVEGIPEGYTETELGNEVYWPAFSEAMRQAGKRVGWWFRADVAQSPTSPTFDYCRHVIEDLKPDFIGCDVEDLPIQEPDLPHRMADAWPDMPRLILVAGMADAVFYRPWILGGFDCMTECYSANIGQPPVPGIAGAVDGDAFWRGFPRVDVPAPAHWGGNGSGPHTWPILEVNAEGNPGLEVQLPAVAAWGENYSIWNAEQMADVDWQLLR